MSAGPRARELLLAALLCHAIAASGGCGRTELDPPSPPRPEDAAVERDGPADAPRDAPADHLDAPEPDGPADGPADRFDASAEAPPDLGYDLPAERPMATDAGEDRPVVCQPVPETCNGADDDCDGRIDEDLAPIPCPDGGERHCVAGRYSECPRRCEVCVPGSRRICFKSFCTYWGSQACSSDGRSFGPCEEWPPPQACAEIARTKMKSRELEECCHDNGYCCVDEFDLDGDGDRTEMIGRCEAVACSR